MYKPIGQKQGSDTSPIEGRKKKKGREGEGDEGKCMRERER